MNLPTLKSAAMSDAELAVALYRTALVLETEGRRAVGACVFGAGSRMMMTADALRRSADTLLAMTPVLRAHDRRAFIDACESLTALAGFLWWERERLECYRAALGRSLEAERRRLRNASSRGTTTSEDIND